MVRVKSDGFKEKIKEEECEDDGSTSLSEEDSRLVGRHLRGNQLQVKRAGSKHLVIVDGHALLIVGVEGGQKRVAKWLFRKPIQNVFPIEDDPDRIQVVVFDEVLQVPLVFDADGRCANAMADGLSLEARESSDRAEFSGLKQYPLFAFCQSQKGAFTFSLDRRWLVLQEPHMDWDYVCYDGVYLAATCSVLNELVLLTIHDDKEWRIWKTFPEREGLITRVFFDSTGRHVGYLCADQNAGDGTSQLKSIPLGSDPFEATLVDVVAIEDPFKKEKTDVLAYYDKTNGLLFRMNKGACVVERRGDQLVCMETPRGKIHVVDISRGSATGISAEEYTAFALCPDREGRLAAVRPNGELELLKVDDLTDVKKIKGHSDMLLQGQEGAHPAAAYSVYWTKNYGFLVRRESSQQTDSPEQSKTKVTIKCLNSKDEWFSLPEYENGLFRFRGEWLCLFDGSKEIVMSRSLDQPSHAALCGEFLSKEPLSILAGDPGNTPLLYKPNSFYAWKVMATKSK